MGNCALHNEKNMFLGPGRRNYLKLYLRRTLVRSEDYSSFFPSPLGEGAQRADEALCGFSHHVALFLPPAAPETSNLTSRHIVGSFTAARQTANRLFITIKCSLQLFKNILYLVAFVKLWFCKRAVKNLSAAQEVFGKNILGNAPFCNKRVISFVALNPV